MIIQLVPETPEEEMKFKDISHINVKEFFIVGSKVGPNGETEEFHEWKGSYKFLISNLYYYLNNIEFEERKSLHIEGGRDTFKSPHGGAKLFKYGDIVAEPVEKEQDNVDEEGEDGDDGIIHLTLEKEE